MNHIILTVTVNISDTCPLIFHSQEIKKANQVSVPSFPEQTISFHKEIFTDNENWMVTAV